MTGVSILLIHVVNEHKLHSYVTTVGHLEIKTNHHGICRPLLNTGKEKHIRNTSSSAYDFSKR